MKKELSSGSCCIHFEEGDSFAGKAIRLSGELVPQGFQLNRQTMDWIVVDNNGLNRLYPVKDDEKDDLIAYIIEEGSEQGFIFELWS